jgi:hypothetical protein
MKAVISVFAGLRSGLPLLKSLHRIGPSSCANANGAGRKRKGGLGWRRNSETSLKRIAKLEEQFGTKDGGPKHLLVIRRLDRIPVLDSDACIELLRKYGHLPTHGCGVVRLARYSRCHGCSRNKEISAGPRRRPLWPPQGSPG